jgi:hypothetical protein
MYRVEKTTNIAGQPLRVDWIKEFTDEHKAISCLMEHAAYDSLDEVREDKYYASSGGTKPETEIEIVEIHEKKMVQCTYLIHEEDEIRTHTAPLRELTYTIEKARQDAKEMGWHLNNYRIITVEV